MIARKRGRPAEVKTASTLRTKPMEDQSQHQPVAKPREDDAEQRPGRRRKDRVPFGGFQQRLGAASRRGYVRRWFNDVDGRINQAVANGWEFVRDEKAATGDDVSSRVSKRVGSRDGGGGMSAYLMEVREDWYNEDQAAKEVRRRSLESQIERGNMAGTSAANNEGLHTLENRQENPVINSISEHTISHT